MLLEIEKSWENLLGSEFEEKYFKEIEIFLDRELKTGKIVYPKKDDIFKAFHTTPAGDVKVVILGQDPYHREGQAHGLSFSVQDNMRIPPSLRNIYKEIQLEYPDFQVPLSGNLSHWAEQGILMLNSILTVEAGSPASHAKCGWIQFTDTVLQKLSDSGKGIIFVLWGAFAQNKKALIDDDKHFVLESPHPSPFSAHRGFLGNGHFKKINDILQQQGKKGIQW